MPHPDTPRLSQLYAPLAIAAGTLWGSNPTATQLAAILLWLAPDWGRKVLALAVACKRFQAEFDPDGRVD
jgi:hypothetical protein